MRHVKLHYSLDILSISWASFSHSTMVPAIIREKGGDEPEGLVLFLVLGVSFLSCFLLFYLQKCFRFWQL
ncbi:hypothetical protein BDF14DRAFT_1753353, partial [Spinellus fusiger]